MIPMHANLHQTPPVAQSLPWQEPLDLASSMTGDHWVLLYSGAQAGYSGRYSYLAWQLEECVEADTFAPLAAALGSQGTRFDPAWFGYLGYGLKDDLETLTPETPGWPNAPVACLMRFGIICEFDHALKTLSLWSRQPVALSTAHPVNAHIPAVTNLRSNMTRSSYLDKVSTIVSHIAAGDLYQANLTRKFMGSFAEKPDSLTIFRKLCEVSPAPYSVLMRCGNFSIISSSPERFLSIDAQGRVSARPIKGTAARSDDAREDEAARNKLAASTKDRAENLMIVDLMRNDLARACVPGTVATETLFEVTTHPTIHHMSSTIVGQRRPECSALDVVQQCFPPGSMTGAPKIAAMNLCAKLERDARGIYSGAIGWFGGDGSCDLSVVIRTLILKDDEFEFQVGGGIVADSSPEREFAETLDKAKGLSLALGIKKEALAGL